MSKRIAVYAGSFDPLTNGHQNLIEKSSKMYDKVIIGILENVDKSPTFSYSVRSSMIYKSLSHLKNVEVKYFSGLLVDFAKTNKADVIIRGMRSVTDFEYELQMCMANKMLDPNIETVFLVADAQYQYISSSMVKQIAKFKGNIKGLVPDIILNDIIESFNR